MCSPTSSPCTTTCASLSDAQTTSNNKESSQLRLLSCHGVQDWAETQRLGQQRHLLMEEGLWAETGTQWTGTDWTRIYDFALSAGFSAAVVLFYLFFKWEYCEELKRFLLKSSHGPLLQRESSINVNENCLLHLVLVSKKYEDVWCDFSFIYDVGCCNFQVKKIKCAACGPHLLMGGKIICLLMENTLLWYIGFFINILYIFWKSVENSLGFRIKIYNLFPHKCKWNNLLSPKLLMVLILFKDLLFCSEKQKYLNS